MKTVNMNKISNTKCDVCLRRGVTTKVRTICNECREFLCKECSDTHLLHNSSQNHSLIDLDPPGEEARSASEGELTSDFLEQATVSETTVLYRAQVAVESKLHGSKYNELKRKSETKSKLDVDIAQVKPTKFQDFSVKRPDDTANVSVKGVLTNGDKCIIADSATKSLKLLDRNGKYLSSTNLKQHPWGITRVDRDKFATCGLSRYVFIWTLCEKSITEKEMYHMDGDAHGIHFNNTYYCILHRSANSVTILDREGRRIRAFSKKEAFGKKVSFGHDIHMDTETNNIYAPCINVSKGLLCMSVYGESLWFTPLSNAASWGIAEIHGTLCIADAKTGHRCLQLMSKTGQYIGKLLESDELAGDPECIHYNETDHKLYISFGDDTKSDIISVYSVQ